MSLEPAGRSRLTLALLAFGMVVAVLPAVHAQLDTSPEAPPESPPVFRDYYPVCNAHGASSMVSDDYTQDPGSPWFMRSDYNRASWYLGVPVFHSYIRGINGTDGQRNWTKDVHSWHKLPGPETGSADYVPFTDGYWAPIRFGNAWPLMAPQPFYEGIPGSAIAPTPIDRFQPAKDLDGDGVCDWLVYGWQIARSTLPGRSSGTDIDLGSGKLEALSGADGHAIWSKAFTWNRVNTQCDEYVYNITGFPTGLLSYNAPSGPRFVWKTTDISYAYDPNNCPNQGPASQWITTEHVSVGDATNGRLLWTRTLLPSVTQFANSTYITGVGDLAGSSEPEVILDNVISNTNAVNVQSALSPAAAVGCPPPVQIGVTALRGEDGATHFTTTNYYTPPHTGSTPQIDGEEDLECFVGAQAKVVHDIDGDHRDDVVGTYLTQEAQGAQQVLGGSQTTQNGRYRTHIAPIHGANGKLIWTGKDIKVQGWGTVSDLTVDNAKSVPYLAVGVIDVPTPQQTGSQFPPKDVRMEVLKMKDGTPLWGTYQSPVPLASYLAYDLTLQQYGLVDRGPGMIAPRDFDGDGVKDLVTPARYHLPNTTEQILLASSGHQYQVLSGKTGRVLSEFKAFGPRGRVVECPGEDANELTVFSGHGKRQDVTRIDTDDGHVVWRHPVYVNRHAVSQVAGRSTIYQIARCGVEEDGRTMFMQSDGFMSYQRGYEIVPPHGYVKADGEVQWLQPKIRVVPPNVATLDDFLPPVPHKEGLTEKIVKPTAAVGTGILSGIGGVGFRNRLRRNGGGA